MAMAAPDVRAWLALAGFNGALAVALGAFAAHGLSESLPPSRVDWLNTASRYQLVHAPALLAIAWARTVWRGWTLVAAGVAFCAGAVLFSGGLYVAALTGWRGIISVVPVGGAGYILGWLLILAAALRALRRD
jgi:uncharacterized membrane protein YgdD (TMEM256/DUF423 family)